MNWSAWIEPMLCRVFRRPNLTPTEQREPGLSEPELQEQPIEEETKSASPPSPR
jgi:hypothetical protein